MTPDDRRSLIELLQFSQWSLLEHADAIEAGREIRGRPITIASNAATICRRYASRAADLIDTFTKE